MEGFLQSLKFKNPDMQAEICSYVGAKAKRSGAKKNWRERQTLYWRGEPISRGSDTYQNLLDRAFDALATNDGFRRALLASGEATLTHSLGKRDAADTVLTQREFCARLTRLRSRLRAEEARANVAQRSR